MQNYYRGSIHAMDLEKTKGYLCGSFMGSPIFSERIEVAYMNFNELKNHYGKKHHHNIIDEFCILIKGSLEQEINGNLEKFKEGDFVFQKAGSKTELKKASPDAIWIVIKSPSLPNDKIND